MLELSYEILESGNLKFTCNQEYRDYLKGCVDAWDNLDYAIDSRANRFEISDLNQKVLFPNYIELERAIFANPEADGWPFDWILPEQVGALTSAPILGDREGEETWIRIWWYPNYQIQSPIDDLIATGETVFDAAP